VAFFTLYVGLTIPYLRSKSQADSKNGDIFGYSVASLIIILLFITMVTELGWPHIQFFEPGIAAVVNIGSTVMLITITTFTFIYTNRTGTRFLIPLLFIYALWIAKGISQSILSDLLSYSTVDSLIPYIVVSVFSIPAFMLSSLMMNESRENEQEIKSASRWIIIGVFVGIISITLAEGVSYALVASSTVDSSPLGRSILLGLCLIAIAELTYISFKLYERNQGQVGLDSLAIALLSLWFIPSLLKGNFQAWTLGWWIGESVLLLGLLVAPAIIGIMYLDTSFRAQQSETRAKVYADLMAHDISNHHQVVMSTIELALLDSTPDFAREKTLKSALRTLFDADRLVRNVRKLGNLEVLSKSELYPCDLLTAISETFDMITKLYPEQTLNFVLEKPMENCKILANDLLPDIFQNLLLNAVEHSDGNTVDVEIELKTNDDSSIWEVRIVDYGPGISPDKRDELFTRYQKGARGTGLGLSLVQALTEFYDGTIRVEDRIPGDYRQGSSFVLQFPAIES